MTLRDLYNQSTRSHADDEARSAALADARAAKEASAAKVGADDLAFARAIFAKGGTAVDEQADPPVEFTSDGNTFSTKPIVSLSADAEAPPAA